MMRGRDSSNGDEGMKPQGQGSEQRALSEHMPEAVKLYEPKMSPTCLGLCHQSMGQAPSETWPSHNAFPEIRTIKFCSILNKQCLVCWRESQWGLLAVFAHRKPEGSLRWETFIQGI